MAVHECDVWDETGASGGWLTHSRRRFASIDLMTAAPPETLTERQDAASRGRRRHRRSRRTGRRKAVMAAAGVIGLAALGAGYVVVGGHGGSSAVADAKHDHAPRPGA